MSALRDTYDLIYTPRIWTARDERNLNLTASAEVSVLVPSHVAQHSAMPRCNSYQEACGCLQIVGPTTGERSIKRVNAAGGRVIECGQDGTCMFHSFLVGAIINPALEPAVRQPRQ